MYGVRISSSVTVFIPSFFEIGDLDQKWDTPTHARTHDDIRNLHLWHISHSVKGKMDSFINDMCMCLSVRH